MVPTPSLLSDDFESTASTMTFLDDDSTVAGKGDVSMKATTRAMAIQALAVSVQDWKVMGQGEDPSVAAPASLKETAERLTALLLVRIVAIVTPLGTYNDLSTSTICRTALMDGEAWCPHRLTDGVIKQLRTYVTRILQTYQDLPFHNFQHAYHVTVSANKLLDLMLSSTENSISANRRPPTFGLREDPLALLALIFAALIHDAEHKGVTNRRMVEERDKLAILYNDQSIQEQHSLHLAFEELLKDRYIELRKVMFPSKEEYRAFRMTVVNAVLSTDLANPERNQITKSKWKEAFGETQEVQVKRQVRRASMASEISMPRTPGAQQAAIKYGYGHGRQSRRGSNASASSVLSDVTTDSFHLAQKQNDVDQYNARHRRLSNKSIDSVFSDDDDAEAFGNNNIPILPMSRFAERRMGDMGHQHNARHRRLSNKSIDSVFSDDDDAEAAGNITSTNNTPVLPMNRFTERRMSSMSVESNYSEFAEDSLLKGQTSPRRYSDDTEFSDFALDSVAMAHKAQKRVAPKYRRASTTSMRSFAADSVDLAQKGKLQKFRNTDRRGSNQGSNPSRKSEGTMHSFAVDSIALQQNRQDGQGLTRNRGNGIYTPVSSKNEDDLRGDFEVSEIDSDDSLSLTPPSSDDEEEVVRGATRGSGLQVSRSFDESLISPPSSSRRGVRPVRSMESARDTLKVPFARRASTGMPERIDEEGSTGPAQTYSPDSDPLAARSDHARGFPSGPVKVNKSYGARLSICRSIDLSGEAIVTYSRRGSIGGMSAISGLESGYHHDDYDEPDALRETVVLELLLRVADVAHSLQNWDSMTKWSSKLFHELTAANKVGRGHDPQPTWFDNQVKIMESYSMPLADQLNEIGIFGDVGGPVFARIVEDNHDRWLMEGFEHIDSLQLSNDSIAQELYFM